MSKPVVITLGDPAGCGPLITLGALKHFSKKTIRFIVVGDKTVFQRYRGFLRLKKSIELVDVKTKGISRLAFGIPSRLSGKASLNYLNEALRIVSQHTGTPIVTAPVSKEAVGKVLPGFKGHTEYLARFFKRQSVVMLMYSEKVKTALLTRHINLKEVPRSITAKKVKDTILLLYPFLKKHCGISHPRIAIAAVNPHAGVNTFLGPEEKVLLKGISRSKKKIYGPYPSDTLFSPYRVNDFDCIISCYHDQAMIPFKLLSSSDGVNVTVGLPIVRTSPAHGAAFDRVKAKKPLMYSSMSKAIEYACTFSHGT
jgi:4-hydroxythreonine-4-phosphate dehydrogenase